ncbi:MAG TPA: hypothetical protein VIG66_03890 [Noviherbaspirillum sp.]
MPSPFFLQGHEIHIWKIDLADLRWDSMSHVLSTDEQVIETRVSDVHKRQRRGRIALRLLLARYTAGNPLMLRFRYGPFGKPELTDGSVHFNLAHSEDSCLLAICPMALGVDLEWMGKQGLNVEELSSSIFHLCDKKEFALLQADERLRYF